MGDVINLRLARKQRTRAAASVQADQNRRLFGRTAAEKASDRAEQSRTAKVVDGARLDREPSDETKDTDPTPG